MKKKWFIGVIAVLFCTGVVAMVMLLLLDPLADDTQAKFDLVQNGMTKKEVEAIFGNEGTRNDILDKDGKRLETREWGDFGDFSVVYDEKNLVILKFQRKPDRTVLEKLERRFGFR